METASQRLLDAASAANDNASDYRLAKLSGFKQPTVSGWRTGQVHMSPSAVLKFCELAGLKDVMRWQVEIGCEREPGPNGDLWRSLRDELTLSQEAGKPVRGGMLDSLYRTIAGKAAATIGAVLAAAMLAHPEPAHARTECPAEIQPSQALATGNLYIMRIAGAFQRVRQFLHSLHCITAPRPVLS